MTLMELIRQTRAGRSYRILEAESGGSPSQARWQQIATKPQKELPDVETIRTIARVLGVGEETVVLAAAGSAGLDLTGQGSLAALLPPAVGRLTERQIGAVITVIRAMLDPGDDSPPSDEAEEFKARGRARRKRIEGLTPPEPLAPPAARPEGAEPPAPKPIRGPGRR